MILNQSAKDVKGLKYPASHCKKAALHQHTAFNKCATQPLPHQSNKTWQINLWLNMKCLMHMTLWLRI